MVGLNGATLEPIVESFMGSQPLAGPHMQFVEHPDEITVWAFGYVKYLGDLLHLRAVIFEFIRRDYATG